MVPLGQPTLIMESTTIAAGGNAAQDCGRSVPADQDQRFVRRSGEFGGDLVGELGGGVRRGDVRGRGAGHDLELAVAEVSAEVVHLIDGDRVQGADRDEHGQRRRPWETGWTGRRNRPLATQRGGQSAGTHHDQRWAGGGSLSGEGVQFGVGRGVDHEDRFGAELVEGAVGTAGDDGGQLADRAWGDWIGAGRGLGHGYAVDQHRAAHHGPALGREGRTDHGGRIGWSCRQACSAPVSCPGIEPRTVESILR